MKKFGLFFSIILSLILTTVTMPRNTGAEIPHRFSYTYVGTAAPQDSLNIILTWLYYGVEMDGPSNDYMLASTDTNKVYKGSFRYNS